jgi:predicted nucleic acid-binding protein
LIYLDTSVALAHLLGEDRRPPVELWTRTLISSRLLEYELWGRLNAFGFPGSHEGAAQRLLAELSLVELTPDVLTRALSPFPSPVRTLDALHLATVLWLREHGQDVTLATYDVRMARAAESLGVASPRWS